MQPTILKQKENMKLLLVMIGCLLFCDQATCKQDLEGSTTATESPANNVPSPFMLLQRSLVPYVKKLAPSYILKPITNDGYEPLRLRIVFYNTETTQSKYLYATWSGNDWKIEEEMKK